MQVLLFTTRESIHYSKKYKYYFCSKRHTHICRVVCSIRTAHAMQGGLTAELLAIIILFRERETLAQNTQPIYTKNA